MKSATRVDKGVQSATAPPFCRTQPPAPVVEKTAADEVTCDQLWSLTAGTEGLSASLKVQARIISTPLPFLLQRRRSCDQAHSLDRRTLSGLELKYQDDSDALFIPVSLSGAKTPLSLLNEMSRRMHLAGCLFLDSRLGRRHSPLGAAAPACGW